MTTAPSVTHSLPSMGRACSGRDPGASKLGEPKASLAEVGEVTPASQPASRPLSPSRARPGLEPGERDGRNALMVSPSSHGVRGSRLAGRRLIRDIDRCLLRNFVKPDPRDLLAPDLIAEVNRLLLRGGRFFAKPSTYRHAQPFRGYAVTANQAVHALYRLLVRIDPRIIETLPDR